MFSKKTWLVNSALVGFFVILLDQTAKWWAFTHPLVSGYLIKPWLGWELFLNPGVAFSLPLPNWLLIITTPFLLAWLIFYTVKKYESPKATLYEITGLVFIISGALSNYIDRVIKAVTVDYLRIFYSVINLADIVIVLGLILILSNEIKRIDKN